MSRIHLSKADITELDRIRQRYSDRQTVVPADRYSIKRNDVFLGTQHVDRVIAGDARDLPADGFDIVYQSTVLSSILDDDFQMELATKMRDLTQPGGVVPSYDFVFNNPSNGDVRKVTVDHLRELFPEGQLTSRRVTLAPPIARRVSRLRPVYVALNALPFLRTHSVCVIRKPHMAVLP